MKKQILLVLNFFFITITAKQEPIRTFAEFARKFEAPEHIRNILKKTLYLSMCFFEPTTESKITQNDTDWPEKGINPISIKTKTIFAKDQKFDRIANAVSVRTIIEQQNLQTLAVAKKYVGQDNYNQWRVVAKGIEPGDANSLSSQEVQELISLQEQVCFSDMYPRNVIRNKKNNKITFIDTEDISFSGHGLHNIWGTKPRSKIECIEHLAYFVRDYDSPDGLNLVQKHIEELKKDPANHEPINWLKKIQNPEITGIDIQAVKTDYQKTR